MLRVAIGFLVICAVVSALNFARNGAPAETLQYSEQTGD